MRTPLLVLALAMPALAQPTNPLARDPWAGTYAGAELKVTLERKDGGYTGTIVLGDQRLPLTARLAGATLEGTFESQGHPFAFTATLDGATLVLVTGGATHRVPREGAAPPAATSVPADWQTYRHALGYGLRYPPGWTLQETELGLTLTPPDLARDEAGQPLEALLINVVPTEGVQKPDDPRALQYVDHVLAQLMPFLRRTGAPAPRALGAWQAVELSYAGKNPTGRDIRGVVLLGISGSEAVLLLLVGDAAKLPAREGVARRVFASAGKGEAQRDARLVGTWRNERYYTSGTFSSTSSHTLILRADGSAADDGQVLANMQHKDSGGNDRGSTHVDSGNRPTGGATWAADGRRLVIRWPDGTTSEWEYELAPGNLLLKGSGQPRLYEKVN
jgi:hypothetical protein